MVAQVRVEAEGESAAAGGCDPSGNFLEAVIGRLVVDSANGPITAHGGVGTGSMSSQELGTAGLSGQVEDDAWDLFN
jgi:hypothetical protein